MVSKVIVWRLEVNLIKRSDRGRRRSGVGGVSGLGAVALPLGFTRIRLLCRSAHPRRWVFREGTADTMHAYVVDGGKCSSRRELSWFGLRTGEGHGNSTYNQAA